MTKSWINKETLRTTLEAVRSAEPSFRYGIQEIERAELTLSFLVSNGKVPPDARGLSAFIAPTVCASREDQALFHRRFVEFLPARKRRPKVFPLSLPASDETLSPAPELTSSRAEELDPPSRADRQVVRRYWRWIVFVIVLSAATFASAGLFLLPAPAASSAPNTIQYTRLAARAALACSPWVIFLLPHWLRRLRRAQLSRCYTFRRFDEIEVRFGERHDTHLDRQAVARALSALHEPAPTGEEVFDARASVAAAIAQGGRSLPQLRPVLREPDILMLLRREGAADHAHRVACDLARHLQSAGVPVAAYEMLGIAERLRPRPDLSLGILPLPGDRDGSVIISDALDAASRAIVILVGNGRGLEAGLDAPQDSAAYLLAAREWRAVVSPVPLRAWGSLELALQNIGYAVVPADSNGLIELAEWVTNRDRGDISPSTLDVQRRNRRADIVKFGLFPRVLLGGTTRLLSRSPPTAQVMAQLVSQLREYLGEAGFAWLGALAVYPRIVPDLTRSLGRRLHLQGTTGSLFSEQGYLALGRLPWVVRGSMPDWLRTALIDALELSFVTQVQRELRNLLLRPTAGGGIALRIVSRSGHAWREVWETLLRQLPPDSNLHDQVFLDFMLFRRRLAVPASHSLTTAISVLTRSVGWDWLLAAACAVLSVVMLVAPLSAVDWLAGALGASGSQSTGNKNLKVALPKPNSLWDTLVAAWPIVVATTAGLLALGFAVLLWLAHRSAIARTVLSDAEWARWLTWPFFFLRHVPAVQRWVLEPWFQAVRRSTITDISFLDPPVWMGAGSPSQGSALLRRLRDSPRLWLHGRSGMGKSSVFAAWERAYFVAADVPNLNTATRRYGFILIAIPLRRYAALPMPDNNRPESWIVEIVRRQLEQHGFATRDFGLVDAMLRAGHIALALDGTNEVDRDLALGAFASQFPQTRLLVTSEAIPRSLPGHERWEVCELPEDIGRLRDGLLALWLGVEKGEILSRRIEAGGLSGTVVSGYDLRLLADLAAVDPGRAALPTDRVALYRAILARATGPDGQAVVLEGLKQLAWTMMMQRRRRIVPDDEKALGIGTLSALEREGLRIVRLVGAEREFRHDQMRAFLAALWLVEETPTLPALQKTVTDAGAFGLNRRDQEELWGFVAPLLTSSADLEALWYFTNEDPVERAILLAALQVEADKRGVTLVRVAPQRERAMGV